MQDISKLCNILSKNLMLYVINMNIIVVIKNNAQFKGTLFHSSLHIYGGINNKHPIMFVEKGLNLRVKMSEMYVYIMNTSEAYTNMFIN